MLFGKDGLTFDGNRALIGLLEQSAAKTGNKKRYIYTSGLHSFVRSIQPGVFLQEFSCTRTRTTRCWTRLTRLSLLAR